MTVYVGVPMWPYRNYIMCHMFADTDQELETMARWIDLDPKWIQKPRASIGPHYDIAKSKREIAIRFGAIACNDIDQEVEAFEKVKANRASIRR